VISLLLTTAIVRGVVALGMFGNLREDPDGYRTIAHHLVAHGIFARDADREKQPAPTAYRPPLYPLLLASTAGGDDSIPSRNVAILQLLLGVATVYLTLLLAWQLDLGAWSFLAAALIAVDPILLNQATLVMTETLATFLSVLCLWLLARFHAAPTASRAGLAGAAIGLAILCRPTFLPWLLPVAILVFWISQGGRGKVAHLVALVGCLTLVLAPWTYRNYEIFGKPIATTTHGGYTLLLGNNDSYYSWVRQGKPIAAWDARSLAKKNGASHAASGRNEPVPSAAQAELVYDAACYEEAERTIRQNPGMFVALSAYRVVQLWSPLPNLIQANTSGLRRQLRYPVAAWYSVVFALALVAGIYGVATGPAGNRLAVWLNSPWLYGFALCLVFTAVHSVYWSNLRMRAPLMPFIACASAIGADILMRKLRPRQTLGERT
jgi:4-amino-4-deoxy-L-arabinose transferase-like glycosyltransferase